MTGYTYDLGRVVNGVQLVNLTLHQFDENDYQGRIFSGECPECPALIGGAIVDAPQAVKDALAAEQAAAHKTASLERWTLDNAFLMVCQSYFGDIQKRGTADLLKKAFEIVSVDQVAGMKAFAVVIGLDKELVRVSGDRWWDSCKWHDDADAVAMAQMTLKAMGA